MKCKSCSRTNFIGFLDLGISPIANNYKKNINEKEKKYPLNIKICTYCWLAQNQIILPSKKLFKKDYSYFSSYSTTWLKHAENLVKMLIKKLKLKKNSKIIEAVIAPKNCEVMYIGTSFQLNFQTCQLLD